MARPKGAKNKLGAVAKENIAAVFTRLGGTAEMAKWAELNKTEFYRIYAKLIPVETEGNANVTVFFDDPTKRPPNGHRRKSIEHDAS